MTCLLQSHDDEFLLSCVNDVRLSLFTSFSLHVHFSHVLGPLPFHLPVYSLPAIDVVVYVAGKRTQPSPVGMAAIEFTTIQGNECK